MKNIILDMRWILKNYGLLLHTIKNYKVHHIIHFFQKKEKGVITLESIACPQNVKIIFNSITSSTSP
jgi:hypothetical protein